MKLIYDLALTFTITPALLGTAFYINYKRAAIVNHTQVVVVAKRQLTETEAYIERFKDVAINEQRLFGIPASISLAQGILESGLGKSKLASNHNNHFGIKCWCKGRKHDCVQMADDSPNDRFKRYGSAWQSWRDHSKFLSSGQYAKLRGLPFHKYAKGLKRIGYATKQSYDRELIQIIEHNNLSKYDKY